MTKLEIVQKFDQNRNFAKFWKISKFCVDFEQNESYRKFDKNRNFSKILLNLKFMVIFGNFDRIRTFRKFDQIFLEKRPKSKFSKI